MKKILVYSIIPLFTFLSCTSNEMDNTDFKGLSIAELEGEWIVTERRSGYSPNDILVDLNVCELGDKIVFNNQGICTHHITNTSTMPCDFENLSLKFIENTAHYKVIEKIDSSSLDYSGCNVMLSTNYGTVLKMYYCIDGNPTCISDVFRKIN